ncbi:hypothetical protein [Stappia sp. TSB10GB4]|uniref:hypothetical protein n=1 Tax=Stappia sp. TSB10GB4 TaxID=2003584 RepID=UPI00352B6A6B
MQRHNEEDAALLVLQEQVLGMAAGNFVVDFGGFGDREDGRMIARRDVDGEAVEKARRSWRLAGMGSCPDPGNRISGGKARFRLANRGSNDLAEAAGSAQAGARAKLARARKSTDHPQPATREKHCCNP